MLQAKDLHIGYRNKTIADQINLEVHLGEMICLLGQNGVGKSTLMRTLSDMQAALSGEIQLEGFSMSHYSKNSLATKIGIVTTKRVGTSNMTVREMVALGRFPYTNWFGKESSIDKEAIESAIKLCEIQYLESSRIGEISDGQFQKTMIARAIAQDTAYVFLDEPTAHLDIVNRRGVFKLLHEIKNKNKGIIISTHELDLALEFSDRLWLMDFNKPLITGRTDDLNNRGEVQKIFHFEG